MRDDHRPANHSRLTRVIHNLHCVQFGHRQCQHHCQSLAAAAAAADDDDAITRSNGESIRVFSHDEAITRNRKTAGTDR